MTDLRFENHGSVVLLRPISDAGREFLDENIAAEPWQYLGGALAVEPRYVNDIAEGAIDRRLEIEGR